MTELVTMSVDREIALLTLNRPSQLNALNFALIVRLMMLLDQIELERRSGRTLAEAVKEATLNRTMAISMAALTTVLGMVPLLTDSLFDQMAATIIGGLVAASVLSLFIMPALYMLFFRAEQQAEATAHKQITEEEHRHE